MAAGATSNEINEMHNNTVQLIQELQRNHLKKHKVLRKSYCSAILIMVIILFFQFSEKELFGSLPLRKTVEAQSIAQRLNMILAGALLSLVLPYLFPLTC